MRTLDLTDDEHRVLGKIAILLGVPMEEAIEELLKRLGGTEHDRPSNRNLSVVDGDSSCRNTANC